MRASSMCLVGSQSHLVCEDTVLVIPPILEEPFQPLNLVKRSALSVSQSVQ